MKENNSPLENAKNEHKMFLQRKRMQQNKWTKVKQTMLTNKAPENSYDYQIFKRKKK